MDDGDAWSEDISCARDCGAAGARPLQSDEDRGHVTRLPAVLHPSSTTLPTHHTTPASSNSIRCHTFVLFVEFTTFLCHIHMFVSSVSILSTMLGILHNHFVYKFNDHINTQLIVEFVTQILKANF